MKRFLATIAGLVVVSLAVFGVMEGKKYNYFRRVAISAAYHDLVRFVTLKPYAHENDQTLTFWGDSLTAGGGATFGHDFPTLITYLFHRPTLNEGIPKQTSPQIRDRFLNRARVAGPEFVVIWAGRNNADDPEGIKRDIDQMVTSLNPGSRYLVMGIINANTQDEHKGGLTYQRIVQLNIDLHKIYGTKYIPIREILIAKSSRASPQDAQDVENDVTASSMRFDELHLNDIGQEIVANSVEEALVSNGW